MLYIYDMGLYVDFTSNMALVFHACVAQLEAIHHLITYTFIIPICSMYGTYIYLDLGDF